MARTKQTARTPRSFVVAMADLVGTIRMATEGKEDEGGEEGGGEEEGEEEEGRRRW